MRSIVLALAVLTILPVPAAQAAPVCDSLERIVPAAGVTTTVRVRSCYESVLYGTTLYQVWTNETRVTTTGVAGETVTVVDSNVHYLVTDAGFTYEERGHAYTVHVQGDAAYANAALINGQYGYDGACSEYTGAGLGHWTQLGNGGVSEYVVGGDSSGYLLPCTPTDVQTALP